MALAAVAFGPEEVFSIGAVAPNLRRLRASETSNIRYELPILIGRHTRTRHLRSRNPQRDHAGQRVIVRRAWKLANRKIRPPSAGSVEAVARRAMDTEETLPAIVSPQRARPKQQQSGNSPHAVRY